MENQTTPRHSDACMESAVNGKCRHDQLTSKGSALTQRQKNALTKARIKMRRSKSLKECLDEAAMGYLEVAVIGFIEQELED